MASIRLRIKSTGAFSKCRDSSQLPASAYQLFAGASDPNRSNIEWRVVTATNVLCIVDHPVIFYNPGLILVAKCYMTVILDMVSCPIGIPKKNWLFLVLLKVPHHQYMPLFWRHPTNNQLPKLTASCTVTDRPPVISQWVCCRRLGGIIGKSSWNFCASILFHAVICSISMLIIRAFVKSTSDVKQQQQQQQLAKVKPPWLCICQNYQGDKVR